MSWKGKMWVGRQRELLEGEREGREDGEKGVSIKMENRVREEKRE